MPITEAGLGTTWTGGAGAAGSFLTSLVTDDFMPRLNDARNNAVAILGLIPESSDRVSGKYIVEPVMTGRNGEAFGFGREGAFLPDPFTTKAYVYAYRTRNFFARMLVDGDLMRATMKDEVAFIDAVDRDFQAMSDDMAVDQGRILYNDGSGRLAEVEAVTSTTIVDIRLNQSWESVATCSTLPTQHLYEGMRLAVVSNAGKFRGATTLSTINSEDPGPPSTANITFGTAVNPSDPMVAGDWLVKVANSSGVPDALVGSQSSIDTSYRAEPMGLSGFYSDVGVLDGNGPATLPANALSYVGTDDYATTSATYFQGIDATATAYNQAIVLDGGGVLRPVNESLLTLVFSAIEKPNNGRVDVMVSNYGVQDQYAIGAFPQKQWHNTTTYHGGWDVLDYKGKPWVKDRLCPENRLFMLGLEAGGFTQHVNTPFMPLSPYGPHWYRLPDQDRYQCAFVMNYNLGVGIRQRIGGLVTDLLSAAA